MKSTKHYGSWKVAISSLPDLRQHPLNYLVNYPRFKSQIATPALQSYFQNKSSLSDLSTALSTLTDPTSRPAAGAGPAGGGIRSTHKEVV